MKRFLPLLTLLLLMATAWYFGAGELLSIETLRQHRAELIAFVGEHPYGAPLSFMALYIATVALSIPGAALLTMAGGFLFPQPWATLYVLVGANIGAICIFLAAKTALGDIMRKGAGKLLKKMETGFQENAASYLLFIRLVPLFPFWLVNLAPAFFGVSLSTYIWTTVIGILPGTFVFTQAGSGIGSILDSGEALSLGSIFTTEVKIALGALGFFALMPIVLKKVWRRRHSESS